jgi:stage III sporulation protein AA
MNEEYNVSLRYCTEIIPKLKKVPQSTLLNTYEIRLKAERPVLLMGSYGSLVFKEFNPKVFEIEEIFKKLCEYSVYSHENEIRNGFITLRGGGRVGIAGTAVIKEGVITGIKDISSLCFRIAHEVKGCAEKMSQVILSQGGALVAGAPGSGKTTFLRDIARILSEKGKKVAVIDERNEISGTFAGQAAFDLGNYCDVLCGYPKKEGMLYAIRALWPQYLICDEIGSLYEAESLYECMLSGCEVIASVHLSAIQDIFKRKISASLINTGAFKNVIFLSNFMQRKYKTEELYEAYGDHPVHDSRDGLWDIYGRRSIG